MNGATETIQQVVGYLNKRNFVSRKQWEARDPKKTTRLKTPIPYVVFTYTHSLACETKQKCIDRVNTLQASAIASCEYSDIKSNFLIGGDGRIYEGRGWTSAPERYEVVFERLSPLNRKCIEVAFIDKYNTKPTKLQAEAAAALIKEGISKNILAKDVKVTTLYNPYTIPDSVRKIDNVRVSRHVSNSNVDPYKGWSVYV